MKIKSKKFYVKKVLDNKNYYDHQVWMKLKSSKNSLIQTLRIKRLLIESSL